MKENGGRLLDNEEILKEQLSSFKRKYPLTVGWRLKRHCKILLEHLHDDEITLQY